MAWNNEVRREIETDRQAEEEVNSSSSASLFKCDKLDFDGESNLSICSAPEKKIHHPMVYLPIAQKPHPL